MCRIASKLAAQYVTCMARISRAKVSTVVLRVTGHCKLATALKENNSEIKNIIILPDKCGFFLKNEITQTEYGFM